jgi:hypothetical protein
MRDWHFSTLRIFSAIIFASISALCGCAREQIEYHSDSLNHASATTIAEHVLLNTVRASLDLPMSFTKLQTYKTQGMVSASAAPKLPFGPSASGIYDVGPTLNLNSGITEVNYADVDTAGALVKLNEDTPYATIERYGADGVPAIVLYTILVRDIFVREELQERIKSEWRTWWAHCSTSVNDEICQVIDNIARDCPNSRGVPWQEGLYTLEGGQRFYKISNSARTTCDFRQFQSYLLALRTSHFFSDLGQESATTYKLQTVPEWKLLKKTEQESTVLIGFNTPYVDRKYKELDKEFKADKKHIRRPPFNFQLRSPRQLLTYLGALIALQNSGDDRSVLEVLVPGTLPGTTQPVSIFRVIRGNPGLEPSALAVFGPYGDTYYVPEPTYGSPYRDQTLRVLSIALNWSTALSARKIFRPLPA